MLAPFMNSPHSVHWHATLKLVKYLRTTFTHGLMYASKINPIITAFCAPTGVVVIELDFHLKTNVSLLVLL